MSSTRAITLSLVVSCFFSFFPARAQVKEQKLYLPELIDFVVMKCNLQSAVKEKSGIDAASGQGLNAVFTANDKELAAYAHNKGMVPLSKYTLSKYQPDNRLTGKPTTTFVLSRERSDGYIRNAIKDHIYVEYSGGILYGKEQWLKKLLTASIDTRTRLLSGNRMMVNMTNKSGIPYSIRISSAGGLTPGSSVISLNPTEETTLFLEGDKIEQEHYNLVIEVNNTRCPDGKKLTHSIQLPGMIYSTGFTPADRYAIIPAPQTMERKEGRFIFTPQTRIVVKDPKAKSALPFLKERMTQASGWTLKSQSTSAKQTSNTVQFGTSDNTALGKEGYTLQVSNQCITIEAREEAGFFYAVQTLLQLMPAEIYSEKRQHPARWDVPAVNITDSPRFEYRGMHLDVGRHLFPVSFIKKYIDLLAMQKMNKFHWHLTEDQGWRIEIKKYPKLTQKGSQRKETLANRYSNTFPPVYDATPYGGYYTQEEVKEVVAYARKRHVTIIPEIDLPGHMLAALAAYPELGCTGGPYEVGTRWGIYDDVLCAGNEKIYPFIEEVLKEVMALFPSQYIHVGGDECPKTRWKTCPKCQEKIKNEKLENEFALQSYVIRRVEKFLNNNGKRLIGWDEILEGGIAPNAALMSWRGVAAGITAAKSGHPVIMTPSTHVYLDHYQANMDLSPLCNGRIASLEWTYSLNPIPAELTPAEAANIKGVQANVWTEYIRTPEMVEYMAYPRANAVAEIGWSTTSNICWESYLKRLQYQFERWKFYGLNYATHYQKQP